MNNYFTPSLLIPEIYFPVKDQENFTANLIEDLAPEKFYRSFEIGNINSESERNRILKAKENYNLNITQWLTFLIDEKKLNVSSLDSNLRSTSIRQIKESLYEAVECGASNIAFVTGEYPGDSFREEAKKGLYESLCDICEEASKYKVKVLLEPLDRFAHKKRLIGPTNEAINLLSNVKKEFSNIGLAFDTAHAALNNENILESISLAKTEIEQIHFSNAVLNLEDELYGDNHMRIGEPGFLTSQVIEDILQKVKKNVKTQDNLRIAIEVRGKDTKNYHENEKENREILKKVLEKMK